MLRHFFAVKNILSRYPTVRVPRSIIQYQIPKYKHKQVIERDPCPPPLPKPPPPPENDALFWSLMAFAICTGAFTVFAKNNPEVRDWISIHASWFDDFIAVAYEENESHADFLTCRFNQIKDVVFHYLGIVEKETCTLDPKGELVSLVGPQPNPDVCDKPEPPVITKDICEIEKCLRELSEDIVHNYFTAKAICAYYNEVVHECMTEFSMAHLPKLHFAMEERLELVKKSLANVKEACEQLEELLHYFECGVQAPKESMARVKKMVDDNRIRAKAMIMEYEWENDRSIAYDRHWQIVERTVNSYTEETHTMYPELSYLATKPRIGGDSDFLLYHSLRYMKILQAELVEAQDGLTDRVDRSLETALLPQNEQERKRRNNLVLSGAKRKRAEMEREYRKRADDLKAFNANRLKQELKKQLDAHNEQVRIQVARKEAEIMSKFNQLVTAKVEAQKKIFRSQLAEMAAKVKKVEDRLNEHIKAEKEKQRSQQLWAAGAALLAATKRGEPVINVDKELRAVQNAGIGDKLVCTVLKAIPSSVRDVGLVPETQLRKKFFLLSDIPLHETKSPPQEIPEHLDTYEVLLRARYWIERGYTALALRYVNALEGASWAAADTWRRNATACVEVKLAAEAIIAHAAALGLRYL